jgi:DNA-binding transcriptional ArsR family regulator
MDTDAMRSNAHEASRLLKLLANPNRLLVLCALVTREHSAGELEELTELSQSALSQHLARFRKAGIVTIRRDAQRIFYSLADNDARAILESLYGIYCSDDEDRMVDSTIL